MEEVISVKDLVVIYPDGTRAVDGISFAVREGEFFGFLGPNGAGKSTTIKVLTTLLRKTSGQATVAGHDISQSPAEIRKVIGVVSQETSLDIDLTGRENLRLHGRLQQLHGQALEERVDELLGLVQLEEVGQKLVGRYSGGMRKRLDLACALVHKPRLLFLDEPTTGLDTQSRVTLWDHLEELNKTEGITIFLTTQYLEEADKLCRELSIIDHGKIIANGSPSALKEAVGGESIMLTLKDKTDLALRTKTKDTLLAIRGISGVSDWDEGVVAYAKNAGLVIAEVVTSLDRNGIHPLFLSVSSPTLDDVFLRETGRRIRANGLGRRETEPFLM
ncbi:MAG TPA: ATP-binding cassette domain-containing protein [Nitrososphaerales archaeon]|nr:ATP-binding cassette domain-containing protein [Nitrososphaerales archaeon]